MALASSSNLHTSCMHAQLQPTEYRVHEHCSWEARMQQRRFISLSRVVLYIIYIVPTPQARSAWEDRREICALAVPSWWSALCRCGGSQSQPRVLMHAGYSTTSCVVSRPPAGGERGRRNVRVQALVDDDGTCAYCMHGACSNMAGVRLRSTRLTVKCHTYIYGDLITCGVSIHGAS